MLPWGRRFSRRSAPGAAGPSTAAGGRTGPDNASTVRRLRPRGPRLRLCRIRVGEQRRQRRVHRHRVVVRQGLHPTGRHEGGRPSRFRGAWVLHPRHNRYPRQPVLA